MPKIPRKLAPVVVVPVPMFEEPDHQPEVTTAQAYVTRREGVQLRGTTDPEETQETPEEAAILWTGNLVVSPTPRQARMVIPAAVPADDDDKGGHTPPPLPPIAPAHSSDVDHDHDCDQPSHAVWFIMWSVEHALPIPSDYRGCRGYGRLRARHVSELR